jgi:V-type H+-transporting ATPase subunit a
LLDSYRQINETLEVLFERKEVLNQFAKLISNSDNIFNRNSLEQTNPLHLNDFEVGFPGKKKSNSFYSKNNKQHLLDENNILEDGNQNGLDFISGTIKAENELRMRRMIFRVTRGRALTTFWNFQIEDHDTHQNILLGGEIKQKNSKKIRQPKKIFTIFFQSSTENIILGKVLKICDLFEASRYSVPRPEEISTTIKEIEMEIREKHNFLCEAEKSMMDFLIAKCGNNQIKGQYHMYKLYFKKEKAIYTNLNKCIVRGNFIDGEVWIPLSKLEKVRSTLKNIYKDSTDKLTANIFDVEASSTKETPPTYIPTNEFFFAFQQIVDTYGVPRYREINPALFNVVTFPFLFGVMFGDIGHGLILLIFGMYLCICNNSIKNEKKHFFKSVLPARYLLLLMGFFAFYAGWLYNDFFSIPIESFGSCYQNKGTIAQREDSDCVYLVGIDPKWYSSKNELTFMNSFKMKFSVILGILHMLLGIFLRGVNDIFQGDKLDFFFEFVPQFIFMTILFGYMDFLIIIKWVTDWTGRENKAPSIITQMMDIFLNFGYIGDTPLWGTSEQQHIVHLGILLVALICVPIMLVVKPTVLNYRLKKEEELNPSEQKSSNDHSHSFSELFVHQMIETIEFVLGAVSNTASYLRLWALSLAHSQLSKVFFEKTLSFGLDQDNIVMSVIFLFAGYMVFANSTFFVLMCMDLLECFLHTLRLHW